MSLIPILAFVLAQDPEHRPEEIEQLRTKTAFTLRQDELEADAIVSFVRLDHARFEHLKDFEGDVTEAAVEVSWGVRDWLTAEVRVPALFLNPGPSGLGDASVDLKAALPKAWAPPYLAVGLRSTLPTANEERGLGSKEPRFMLYVAASQEVGDVTGHLQLLAEAERTERAQFGLNAAVDVALRPDFSALLGLNLLGERGESLATALIPGFEFRLTTLGLQFGVGVPVGLSSNAEDWGIIFNAQISF